MMLPRIQPAANEPPDPAMEQAGIMSLQAQELTVDHSVCQLYLLFAEMFCCGKHEPVGGHHNALVKFLNPLCTY